MVTHSPKVYPPDSVNELRKISGVINNLSKIAEKMLGQFMILDMSKTRDQSQYGNEKGIYGNHSNRLEADF